MNYMQNKQDTEIEIINTILDKLNDKFNSIILNIKNNPDNKSSLFRYMNQLLIFCKIIIPDIDNVLVSSKLEEISTSV